MIIKCACACGTELEDKDTRGRPRKFLWGHGNMRTLKKYARKKGGKPWNKGIKTGHTPWNKGLDWKEMQRENNPAWRGGTSFNRSPRWRKEYKRLRKRVLERDNYQCINCGATKEQDRLHLDHIKSWKDYPELRFEISNCRILCWTCHKKTPTYGYRKSS